ncbi:hypothetical protein [Comamonas sp. GB3 AK4-5]|uniref:hypothetical protein n=1 Tax=Comamonas sp. GB3 AK4-5 TaxID=3231487 RepID=UPI00351EDBA5
MKNLGSDNLKRLRQLHSELGTLNAANYDIASKCNLRCEGCLFFEGDEYHGHSDSRSELEWDKFFESEARRGVNLAYLAGAEPSLVPERIRSAQRHISNGIIFTNGIIRLPDDINYRIHISSWGTDETGMALRAGNILSKALNNYKNDPRAVCIFTISALNIDNIIPMAQMAESHGLPLTFSYFSPTTRYIEKIQRNEGNDKSYFRISNAEKNLVMSEEDFSHARGEIQKAINRFPNTIRYSLAYDSWVTSKNPYNIDPITGIANDCGVRLTKQLHFHIDHEKSDGKCCSSNIDCRQCRAYAMGLTTYLSKLREKFRNPEDLSDWIEVREMWAGLFLNRK